MVGVNTLTEALQRIEDTRQVTFTTTQVPANGSIDFKLDSNDDNLQSISYKPSDADNLLEGQIVLIRVVASGQSTNTDLLIYEDSDRNGIDEVIRITGISSNDAPTTIQPGAGVGVKYENQQDKRQMYFTVDEKSNNSVTLDVRVRWFDVTVSL